MNTINLELIPNNIIIKLSNNNTLNIKVTSPSYEIINIQKQLEYNKECVQRIYKENKHRNNYNKLFNWDKVGKKGEAISEIDLSRNYYLIDDKINIEFNGGFDKYKGAELYSCSFGIVDDLGINGETSIYIQFKDDKELVSFEDFLNLLLMTYKKIPETNLMNKVFTEIILEQETCNIMLYKEIEKSSNKKKYKIYVMTKPRYII